MFARKNIIYLTVVISVFCFGWYGCSDSTLTTIISGDQLPENNNNSAIAKYLPLDEGYTSVYDVSYSNGTNEKVTIKVGKEISIFGFNVTEWISHVNNATDTGYFRVTSDAIYFYDNINVKPDKILELPLTSGRSWSRFANIETTQIDTSNFTDIITSFDNNKSDTTNTKDNPVNKTFPTANGNTMTVVEYEQLVMKNGEYYSQALKIYNEDPSGVIKNYYWFVANIGLVKYVLGATDESYPGGTVVGELIDYGY
ncbi:MAG: hypothetical protein ACE5D6_03305 [Candidatus Zixiibacteriota bacterium]